MNSLQGVTNCSQKSLELLGLPGVIWDISLPQDIQASQVLYLLNFSALWGIWLQGTPQNSPAEQRFFFYMQNASLDTLNMIILLQV